MNDTPNKNYSNIKITELPNSEVEIEGEIAAEKIESAWSQAVKRLSETLDIPGFRKGKAPENVLAKHLGSEYPILEDAAEIALSSEYPKILDEHKIDAIGRPEIQITKIARGNPLGFKAKTAVVPVFELPDYAAIAKEKGKNYKTPEVSEKDADDALDRIRRNKAHYDLHKKLGIDVGQHDHPEIKDEDLPALDDAFAKSLGGYESLADLKTKVKDGLAKDKEYQEREKVRIGIIDGIMEKADIPLPPVLTESELEKMIAQFKDDIARSGLTFEDYLKQLGKSEEEVRTEWRPSAEKKAKYQLILNKIAEAEHIEADAEMLDHESKQLAEMYKDADPLRVRVYVETMLVNDKVLKFLESKTGIPASAKDEDAQKAQ